MKRKILLASLLLTGSFFACDRDDDIYVTDKEEIPEYTPVHVMNDMSQYWSPALAGREGSLFGSFLDYEGKKQYMTQSSATPRELRPHLSTVNVINVFLDMKNGQAYDAQDLDTYRTMVSTGGGVAFYAMGDGAEAMAQANLLANEFGFQYQAGPVGQTVGGGLKAFNAGFFLELADPGKWEVLAEADGKPVCAIREMESGKVFASGFDLFGTEKVPANYDFFQGIITTLSANKQGFVPLGKFKNPVAPEKGLDAFESSVKTNEFLNDEALAIKPIYDELAETMQTWSGFELSDGGAEVNLLPSDTEGWTDGNSIYIGAFYGGFPAEEEMMRKRLGELIFETWSASVPEPIGENALSIYANYKLAELLGDAEADTEVMDYIAKAKANSQYRAYDPVNMTAEERSAFPMDLRVGKYLNMIDSVQKAYPDIDFFKNYLASKKSDLPDYDGFVYTPHDAVWLMGEVVGDDEFLENAKANTGYGFMRDGIRNPSAYDRIILDPSWWKAECPESNGSYPPSRLFDGNENSFWHTWWGSFPDGPGEVTITVDMFETNKVMGFRFLPRKTGGKDMISHMVIYASENKEDWGEAVAEFKWNGEYEHKWYEIFSKEFKQARYVRIDVKEAMRYSGGAFVVNKASQFAEFRVYSEAPDN
ncbi:hypothetical protein FUAX_28700 [Fulvitalea axinellae]|uniref:F5/8 type C domain-containing protein n=1 Tax=Fulvitalea axinellae TaxID=1182444 RepID=A0AAU9CJW2_9BACT|nr:hypothetical protein FUAX_28700 [Fulvitalea axinellae]